MKRFRCKVWTLNVRICFNHRNYYKSVSQLMAWELDAFHHYHVGVDNCKWALSWQCTKDHKFPTMALLAWQILGITMNQIKIEDSFNCCSHCILVVLVANWSPLLDACVNKNWPNYPRVDYSKPSNLASAWVIKSEVMKELDTKFEDKVEWEKNSWIFVISVCSFCCFEMFCVLHWIKMGTNLNFLILLISNFIVAYEASLSFMDSLIDFFASLISFLVDFFCIVDLFLGWFFLWLISMSSLVYKL